MYNDKIIHLCIIISVIIIILVISGIIILKYNVEGEKNLPFEISKMIVISSAEGIEQEKTDSKWEFNINQNNDVYISIDKNKTYKNKEVIKSITINNFIYNKFPEKGKYTIYNPANSGLFKNTKEYIVNDKIEYKGSKSENINNLEIANQGGTIVFRYSNENIAKYKSNEDEEIVHNGKLISKTDVTYTQIQSNVSFDVIVETGKGIKYKTTINLDFPVENILETGIGKFERNDFKDLVFKRI